ncbi:MAG: CHC2 zinc finger domain-containing protein [Candidatus Eremiobacterota bacterium]
MPHSTPDGPYSRSELDALKARVDLVEVLPRYGVELKRKGKNWLGRCPFHEDRQASLSVNREARLWNCFGCSAGGDVLSFLEKRQGLSFADAVKELSALAGSLPPAPPRPEAAPSDVFPGGLTRGALLGRAVELYSRRLRETPAAQEYLARRGLGSRELWDAFQLGFADGTLLSTLPPRGEVPEALTRLGVLTAGQRELMNGCLVVPLSHPDQGVVGLYGRRIDPEAEPAHLYLPGPRRGVLNWQALRSADSVWLAESVLDALSLWAAGVREVTALYGVQGMPRDLEELLGRYQTREVRLCLDGDRAGREATERVARRLAGRGLRCSAVSLPEGQDPNGLLVEEGPAGLKERLSPLHPVEPDGEERLAEPERPAESCEHGEEGLVLWFAEVQYRVTPRPPFGGRLRVTLRARRGKTRFVDNLDLYSHRQRVSCLKQIARRLELGLEEVERQVLRVVDETEQWVDARREDPGQDPQSAAPEPMNERDREEALAFLRRPDLVQALLADMETLGYVGEDKAKLLAYLIGLSRKLDRPLSGIILSQAGAGKSGLTELVESLTPPEEVVLYSRISAQALGYLPKDFLKRKLLILEERVGAEAAEYAIRVLQSRQRLSQAVTVKDPATGKMQTRHYEVEGPIAYLETTTNPDINHENATRCFELSLDESEEQTRRIHRRQRQARSHEEQLLQRRAAEGIQRRHHNAQRLLEPVGVVIPYVEHLTFPSRWLRTRRDHERFLCLIEGVAFLHQFQRSGGTLEDPETGRELRFVRANLEDYRLAYELAGEVLRSTLHELTRDAQELLAAIQELVTRLGGGRPPEQVEFIRRELRNHVQWQDRRLRTALNELVEMEYVAALAGSQGRTYRYVLLGEEANPARCPLSELTTPAQLEACLARL